MRVKVIEGLQAKGGHVEAPFSLRGGQEEEYIRSMSWHMLHHGMAEKTSISLAPCVHDFHVDESCISAGGRE